MKALAWGIVAGLWLWASSGCPALAAASEVRPVADEEMWKVFRTVMVECTDYEARSKAVQEVIQKDRERAVSAAAYYLGQESTRYDAVVFVHWHLKDPRLVPFVAEVIRSSQGLTFFEAVKTARAMKDRRFLAVLMERPLDSDYDEMNMHPGPIGSVQIYQSVFAEAAAAIYALTDGQAGSDVYPRRPVAKENRSKLAAQWRQWWAENKAKWDSAAPSEPKPATPEPKPPA